MNVDVLLAQRFYASQSVYLT